MKSFKDLFLQKAFNLPVENHSVSVSNSGTGHELFIRFNSKDIILTAGYTGKADPWLSSLCFLIQNKSLSQALVLGWSDWDSEFKEDPTYWEMKQDYFNEFIFWPVELLRAAMDVFRGREYLYKPSSPLICRCFGVREDDITGYLKTEPVPTIESLSNSSRAGMGCRSCVPELKRWLTLHEPQKKNHHYKDKSHAEWLLQIDYMISCFPFSQEWKMEVGQMRNSQVMIYYEKKVNQLEEEQMTHELQEFLAASVDSELSFFLKMKS